MWIWAGTAIVCQTMSMRPRPVLRVQCVAPPWTFCSRLEVGGVFLGVTVCSAPTAPPPKKKRLTNCFMAARPCPPTAFQPPGTAAATAVETPLRLHNPSSTSSSDPQQGPSSPSASQLPKVHITCAGVTSTVRSVCSIDMSAQSPVHTCHGNGRCVTPNHFGLTENQGDKGPSSE